MLPDLIKPSRGSSLFFSEKERLQTVSRGGFFVHTAGERHKKEMKEMKFVRTIQNRERVAQASKFDDMRVCHQTGGNADLCSITLRWKAVSLESRSTVS